MPVENVRGWDPLTTENYINGLSQRSSIFIFTGATEVCPAFSAHPNIKTTHTCAAICTHAAFWNFNIFLFNQVLNGKMQKKRFHQNTNRANKHLLQMNFVELTLGLNIYLADWCLERHLSSRSN